MREKVTLERAQNLAARNGGKCLKLGYSKEKSLWQCDKDHVWLATFNSINSGHWCSFCRLKQTSIDKLKEFAHSKSGDCLSNSFKNNKSKVIWECQFGHTWEAIISNVMCKNKWCPTCSKNKKLTIDDAKQEAIKRNGECLSTEYKNTAGILEWKCEKGHIWKQNLNNIRRGSWCPCCLEYLGENFVRNYFQDYLNEPFIKLRPVWLRFGPKIFLELDGYNEKLKIAFEYNGIQHYKFSKAFHKNEEDLLKQQKYDKFKVEKCKEMGIDLIVIPYFKINNADYCNKILDKIFDELEIKC